MMMALASVKNSSVARCMRKIPIETHRGGVRGSFQGHGCTWVFLCVLLWGSSCRFCFSKGPQTFLCRARVGSPGMASSSSTHLLLPWRFAATFGPNLQVCPRSYSFSALHPTQTQGRGTRGWQSQARRCHCCQRANSFWSWIG